MLKLYYAAGACSLSPHIVLLETGTAFELVKTDLRAKKTEKGDDYLAKNPGGFVPALELEDGSVLTEGPVIVQYIADKAGKLAPKAGSIERYRMMSWLNFISSELHKGFSPLFNAAMPDEAKKIVRDRLNLAARRNQQAPHGPGLRHGQRVHAARCLPVHGAELDKAADRRGSVAVPRARRLQRTRRPAASCAGGDEGRRNSVARAMAISPRATTRDRDHGRRCLPFFAYSGRP